LFSNAIKFTPSGKKISILVKPSELSINDKELTPVVLFSVRDQGIGIPNDELDVVFDKFVQSSKSKTGSGGTGLGLAICKEIIDAHNSKIWAENNPEEGATFSFMLPVWSKYYYHSKLFSHEDFSDKTSYFFICHFSFSPIDYQPTPKTLINIERLPPPPFYSLYIPYQSFLSS
jgi:hypothetical protein